MKDALVIFMVLLVLLLIISVFGGSVRPTPVTKAPVGSSSGSGIARAQWSAVPQPWGGESFTNPPAAVPPSPVLPSMPSAPQPPPTSKYPKPSPGAPADPPAATAPMTEGFTSVQPFSSEDKHAAF